MASLKTEVDQLDFDKLTPVPNDLANLSNVVKNDVAKRIEYNKLVTKLDNTDTTDFVKKTDYVAEITKIKNDYVTNAELDARHKDLVQKTTFNSELKKVDDKASANNSKVLSYEHKSKQREDTINDLERDASYCRSNNYFAAKDGTQNDLVFQVSQKYFDSNWDQ